MPSEADNSSEQKTILFLGDSFTDGYELGKHKAFPSIVQERIEALQWNIRVINAGRSGDTTGDARKRLRGMLDERVDLLFVALGANDIFRGLEPDEARHNLKKIIESTRARYPDVIVVLAGIRSHWTWQGKGKDYEGIYPELARELDAELLPHLLEGVLGVGKYLMEDGVHPNAAGQRVIGETVWEALTPILQDMTE